MPVGFSPHRPYLDTLLLGTTLRAARRFRPDVLHGHLHEGAAIASVVGRLVGRPAVADLQGSVAGEMIAHGHLPAGGPVPAALRRSSAGSSTGPRGSFRPRRTSPRSSSRCGGSRRRGWCCSPTGSTPTSSVPGPAPDRLREQLGLVGKRVVLYLGVLTEYQGIDDLLLAWPQVMAAVPDAHLLIVGHPNVEHYRARAAELPPRARSP